MRAKVLTLGVISLSLIVAAADLSLFTPNASAAPNATVRMAIRALYYGETQAFNKSTKDGLIYSESREYPQFVLKNSAGWARAKKILIAQNYELSPVPNLSTIDSDPSWIPTPGSGCVSIFSKPPKGDTYVVSVDFGDGHPADVHVTILNGKAYKYFDFCQAAGVKR
jgi:hypothetical protein